MEAADVVNETQQSTIFERVDRWLTLEYLTSSEWYSTINSLSPEELPLLLK